MIETLLKQETIDRVKSLTEEVESCYQVNKELTNELMALEKKCTVRFINKNQQGTIGGGSNIGFYALLPESFKADNKVLIANTQSSEFALNEAKNELRAAKMAALDEIAEAAKEQYLMAANVLKQQHAILYGLASRASQFEENIHCLSKLNIPCNFAELKQENTGNAGEPTIIHQPLAVRHGTAFGQEVSDFMKPTR